VKINEKNLRSLVRDVLLEAYGDDAAYARRERQFQAAQGRYDAMEPPEDPYDPDDFREEALVAILDNVTEFDDRVTLPLIEAETDINVILFSAASEDVSSLPEDIQELVPSLQAATGGGNMELLDDEAVDIVLSNDWKWKDVGKKSLYGTPLRTVEITKEGLILRLATHLIGGFGKKLDISNLPPSWKSLAELISDHILKAVDRLLEDSEWVEQAYQDAREAAEEDAAEAKADYPDDW